MLTYEVLSTDRISPLFETALEAVEEAVYNSLLQATTISSRFGTAEAIPIEACSASCKSTESARETDELR